MADNVNVTEGSGTSIATDQVGSQHYQQVKLVDGTADSASPIPGDSTNGLLVNLGTNNDVTATGTVTANLGAVDNAVLDDIASDSEAIKTSVQTIDDIVSGSEAQVDIVGSLPTGTNAIGKLAANDGVDIGDVDVASIAAGTNVVGKVRMVTATGDEVTEDTDNSVNVTVVADDVGIGGGTEYTEGDTDASINGKAILMEGAGNTLLPVQGTVADGLLANLGTNNDVTVTSGSVAAEIVDGGGTDKAVVSKNMPAGDETQNALYVRIASFYTGANLGISATDLDIRDLTSTDVVTVTGGAGQTADVKVTLDSESVATDGAVVRGVAAGLADTGFSMLGKYQLASAVTTVDDGDYDYLSLTDLQELRVRDQRQITLDTCEATTGWSALNNDTTGLATTTNHVFGTKALTFNKVDGAANTVFGCIQKTLTTQSISRLIAAGGFVGGMIYLPSLTNVVNAFIRIGTDSTNYNQFTFPVDSLTTTTWLDLRTSAAAPDYANNAGNGWNTAAITYVAIGVTFSSASNTLAGICCDHIYVVGGRVTTSEITATVTSSVTTPNINLLRVSGSAVGVAGAGVVAAGTQRITHASDDPVTTAVQLIDDAIYVDDTATHATGTSKGMGIMAAATPTDSAISANDIGMVSMSLDRKLLVDANIQMGDADVASGNPLQVSLANTAANTTAVKVAGPVDSKFYTNHIDGTTTASVTYIGKETADGTYLIMKIDSSGSFPVITYASITNNGTEATYTSAWAARATTLVYNIYATAF